MPQKAIFFFFSQFKGNHLNLLFKQKEKTKKPICASLLFFFQWYESKYAMRIILKKQENPYQKAYNFFFTFKANKVI